MRQPPPDVVAAWPEPDYLHPASRGPALLIVELSIVSLASVVLAGRLYCRLAIMRNAGLDDALAVVAMIFGIGVTVCVILANQLFGWNIHIWDLSADQTIRGRQVSLAAQTLYLFASGFAKLAILFAYLRIAPLGSKFRMLSYWTISLVLALMLVFIVVLWAQCVPIHTYWDLDDNRHCIDEGQPLIAQSITNVLTDLIVYILPLPTMITLRLPLSQRIGLVAIFSLGFIVVVAGCLRTYYTWYVVEHTWDVSWYGFDLWIWTAVEANLGIICGSIPTMRPLYRLLRGQQIFTSRKAPGRPKVGSQRVSSEHGAGMGHWVEGEKYLESFTQTISSPDMVYLGC